MYDNKSEYLLNIFFLKKYTIIICKPYDMIFPT